MAVLAAKGEVPDKPGQAFRAEKRSVAFLADGFAFSRDDWCLPPSYDGPPPKRDISQDQIRVVFSGKNDRLVSIEEVPPKKMRTKEKSN